MLGLLGLLEPLRTSKQQASIKQQQATTSKQQAGTSKQQESNKQVACLFLRRIQCWSDVLLESGKLWSGR